MLGYEKKLPENKGPESGYINPYRTKSIFLAHFWSLGRPLWMQYLSKKSQIFGEHVV
jgi:hypothetical protein